MDDDGWMDERMRGMKWSKLSKQWQRIYWLPFKKQNFMDLSSQNQIISNQNRFSN